MNIDERIKLEMNRHYEKIKELNDLLKMYNNNARENASYVERNVDQAVAYGIDPNRIVSYEESRQYTNPYAKQIEDIKVDIQKENELHERNMADLTKQKQEMEQQRIEDELVKERERQQKEIELISLQQEINKIENERLEIEKRLRTISSETLGSYFSRQISERYPDEYQKFQQNKEQVRNYSSKTTQISDLKERYNKVAEDLKFYQDVLPVYESYYQRFEEIKNERQQQIVSENEQEKIYNLIYSAENERLKRNRSLYTVYLGNKTIPPEYQGMSYEQVKALLDQKQAEEKARQEAQATRDELIGKAISNLMFSENYHLSQIQIKNLSEQFTGYSNEELQEFITSGKKQKTILEVQPPLAPEISQSIQQPFTPKIQMPEIMHQPTSDYNDFEKNLISFIETKNSNLGKVSEVISVTGYPDSTYKIRFENGKIHQITITQNEKDIIRNQTQNQKPIQQQSALEVSVSEIPQNIVLNSQAEEKNRLINNIIDAMLNASEFHDSGLDISQKMKDIEYAKNKLKSKSIEELEWTLSVYTPQQENINFTGMKK